MTDVTDDCTFNLLSCRDAKMYCVTMPTSTVGGDTFTVDNSLDGLKLTTIKGCYAQRSASATASATYSSTTVTLAAAAGATARAYYVVVWGTD